MRVFGGSGGGAGVLGGTAWESDVSRVALGGGGGAGPRLGVGGGIGELRSPWNGGGTPNFGLVSISSSMGVFGGLGGGGGPGLVKFDTALCLAGGAGVFELAYFPAPSIGGGALNLDVGRGEGVLSGDLAGDAG